MAYLMQAIQLASILGDDKLLSAVTEFIRVATIFGFEESGDDERSAAFNDLSDNAAAISTRIGILFQPDR